MQLGCPAHRRPFSVETREVEGNLRASAVSRGIGSVVVHSVASRAGRIHFPGSCCSVVVVIVVVVVVDVVVVGIGYLGEDVGTSQG